MGVDKFGNKYYQKLDEETQYGIFFLSNLFSLEFHDVTTYTYFLWVKVKIHKPLLKKLTMLGLSFVW